MIPITGHTKLTGLLGSPVEHSISPMMHNTGFQALGLDYVYLCFEVNETYEIMIMYKNKVCFLSTTYYI